MRDKYKIGHYFKVNGNYTLFLSEPEKCVMQFFVFSPLSEYSRRVSTEWYVMAWHALVEFGKLFYCREYTESLQRQM